MLRTDDTTNAAYLLSVGTERVRPMDELSLAFAGAFPSSCLRHWRSRSHFSQKDPLGFSHWRRSASTQLRLEDRRRRYRSADGSPCGHDRICGCVRRTSGKSSPVTRPMGSKYHAGGMFSLAGQPARIHSCTHIFSAYTRPVSFRLIPILMHSRHANICSVMRAERRINLPRSDRLT